LADFEAGLGGSLRYAAELFDRATTARMASHFEILLEGALAAPERRLSELPLLAPEETRQLLSDWNPPALPPPSELRLHDLIAAAAARVPEALAVTDGEEAWSYADLLDRSGRVTSRLRSLGVGPEDRVGVCLRRRPGLVAALLGVLEAGAAYVPLDPAYPEERLRFLLEDAGVRALITERELRPSLAFFSGATALLEDLLVEGESPSGVPIHPSPTAGNLAYLIYTSGSTGRPKGVGIEHRSAVALVRWALAAFSAEELAGVLAATSVCFDLSVFELFAPLAAGGAVVLAENALALPRAASQARITLVNTVPSALAEILAAGALPASVRAVNLAGEALPGALVAATFAFGPGVDRVLNLYGPSEDTTYSTGAVFLRAEEGTARAAQPPIGRPLPGTQ